ncbi:MAG: hypothetical protein YHS30scaffold667_37 [Phage 65_10]|nr:MAG: hypothetical protein YHS30scaffold667_37 [Phage 65_10]
MHGTPTVPFSALFADTEQAFGVAFARAYYTKRGMPAWEFGFWLSRLSIVA